jgi:hypothetical protein
LMFHCLASSYEIFFDRTFFFSKVLFIAYFFNQTISLNEMEMKMLYYRISINLLKQIRLTWKNCCVLNYHFVKCNFNSDFLFQTPHCRIYWNFDSC